MPTQSATEARFRQVMERVRRAEARAIGRRVSAAASGRAGSGSGVLVVAVTKYADLEQIRELVMLGHRDFGESQVLQLLQRAAFVDEVLARQRTMKGVVSARKAGAPAAACIGTSGGPASPSACGTHAPAAAAPPAADETSVEPVRWHMIGHLQRNKVKKCLEVARLIHSVDSLRLVEEIQSIAFKRDRVIDVLVQVNCAEEKGKFGCAVAAAPHLCEQIDTMVHLRVRGLMTMAPYSEDPEDSRPTFERCAELFHEIRSRGVGGAHFNILSMGMSGDFEVAIECGANMVRIGSAIFGQRRDPESVETDEEE